MTADEQAEHRRRTALRRNGPRVPVRLSFAFDGTGELPSAVEAGAVELVLEATDAEGTPAAWLDGDWWADAIERFGETPVTVSMLPTRRALFCPVILHHVRMLRQTAPRWRIIGSARAEEFTSDADIELAATSAYHEIRLHEPARDATNRHENEEFYSVAGRLIGRMRTIQSRAGLTTPVLVRLAANTPALPMVRVHASDAQGVSIGRDPRIEHAT
jgi:hypothetical protein